MGPVPVQMWQAVGPAWDAACRPRMLHGLGLVIHGTRSFCLPRRLRRKNFDIVSFRRYLLNRTLSSSERTHTRTHGTHRCVCACRVARRIRLVPSPIAIAVILVAIRLLQASTAASAYVERSSVKVVCEQSQIAAMLMHSPRRSAPHSHKLQ